MLLCVAARHERSDGALPPEAQVTILTYNRAMSRVDGAAAGVWRLNHSVSQPHLKQNIL
jgi:hypothetical protein